MKSLFIIVGIFIADLFRSRTALQMENLALRHQLAVFQRTKPRAGCTFIYWTACFGSCYHAFGKVGVTPWSSSNQQQ